MEPKIKDLPEKTTVLVVEDERELRSLLRQVLSKLDVEVLEAGDGEEAIEVLKNHEVDCILSDIQMPKKDGLELLAHLVAEGSFTPVVMLTAHAGRDNLAHALRLGALDFISKPFGSKQVLSVMSRAVEIGKRRRSYQHRLDELSIDGKGSPELYSRLEHERKMIRLLQVVNSSLGHEDGEFDPS